MGENGGEWQELKAVYGYDGVEIPEELRVGEFMEMWMELMLYRSEMKLKPWKGRTIKMQFRRMARWGVERACRAIEYSIAQGYQGVFEPNDAPAVRPLSDRIKVWRTDNYNSRTSDWRMEDRPPGFGGSEMTDVEYDRWTKGSQ